MSLNFKFWIGNSNESHCSRRKEEKEHNGPKGRQENKIDYEVQEELINQLHRELIEKLQSSQLKN
jgi:hypothetical protein